MTLRQTSARQAIANVLARATTPLTVPEMLTRLERHGEAPHKTTVYRELECLMAAKEVQLVMLPDGVARYEAVHEDDHHHHAVCEGCGTIAELHVHEDLSALERSVSKQTGFSITGHLLEFLGRCKSCRT